jgi:tripartite-type tricarboxylate transporter receptor subunit TctC
VVVDSRPGADGIIAAEAFLGTKDKDHTFLVTFGGLLINNPVSYDRLPYDAERDFVPVAMLVVDTIVICANSGINANDMAELIRLMRERPEAVRWASAPGEPRLRFFGALKHVDAQPLYVPYKATSQAVTDLIAGRIEIMVAPLASVLPNVRAGKLKLIAVMAAQRSPAIPDVPSVVEAGFPGLAMLPFIGLFARSGTRAEIVERLNHEINAVLADPDVRRRLMEAGLSPSPGTPTALGSVVASKLQENRVLARMVGPIWQ